MRAVIFDFDGLILDTEWPEVVAWQETFDEFQVEMPEFWWIDSIGRGSDQEPIHPADILEQRLGRSVNREALIKKCSLRRQFLAGQEAPLPGVLDRIHEAIDLGWKLAIASSSGRSWVESHLQHLGIRELFCEIVCREDVVATKPSPDLYLAALTKIGTDPTEAFALEDSPAGISSALAAGMKVVAVPNRLTKELDTSHATLVVKSLKGITLSSIAYQFGQNETIPVK